jgi:FtsZ-binding cell division protein ZapB
VRSALTLIGKLFVEEMDAGTDNWHARYLQAQKDKDRLACTITELESKNQDLTNALQGREETLKGWQTSHAGIIKERDTARSDLAASQREAASWRKRTLDKEQQVDALVDESAGYQEKANQFANERDAWAERFKALDADMHDQRQLGDAQALPDHYAPGEVVWVVNKNNQSVYNTQIICVHFRRTDSGIQVFYTADEFNEVAAERVHGAVMDAIKYMKGEN